MPLRNMVVIALSGLISLFCYQEATRHKYASEISSTIDLIRNNYVEEVDDRQLFESAMSGMAKGLDQHSVYISPDNYSRFRESLDQEFGGVGIMVEMSEETERITVMAPLVGTPAHRAGVLAGDTIMAIDGTNTEGLTLEDAVPLMRGAPGEEITLSVIHPGETGVTDLTMQRENISVDSVLGDTRRPGGKWNFYLEEEPKIGLVRINSFGEHTVQELRKALADENSNFDALIIDLRDNAGGLLNAAAAVCDMFLEEGVIVTTRKRGGEVKQAYNATSTISISNSIPIVVLTNNNSASASEIVAACLQDHERAVVIGERTFGKGTVQNIFELEGGRSALKLTTASYWRPSGLNIHRRRDATEEDDWGVRPDEGFEVIIDTELLKEVMQARRDRDLEALKIGVGGKPSPVEEDSTGDSATEDEEEVDDPQMRKAIEYLKEQI